ncbi:MAG: carbamate kinase [Candidatus Fimimorpha sp.]
MSNKRVVVALGRQAFGKNLPEQKSNVSIAASAIADLVQMKYQVVITHSNGPQVGMIHTAMNEFSQHHEGYTPAPMSVCSAMSQGYIGYDLQNAIRTELLNRGIYKPVCTIITQVKVDPFDRAFNKPIKSIGRILNDDEADAERKKGNYVTKEENGWRRIIASPAPIEVYELDSIRMLADAGHIVIAAGGGGIPVLEQGTRLKGASAVIEKDAVAAKLAHELDADVLLFLTSDDQITIDKGTENEKKLGHIHLEEAFKILDSGLLSQHALSPKLSAAAQFVANGSNRIAISTHLNKAKDGIREKVGTIVEK